MSGEAPVTGPRDLASSIDVASHRCGSDPAYSPLVARTSTLDSPIAPVAYDCLKVIVVRDGSAILLSEFWQKPVRSGDVIVLAANTLCGSDPEGRITVTTIYADSDYVLDQLRWQYAGVISDRLDAQGFIETVYAEPVQILRLGEARASALLPWLDEFVSLSADGRFSLHFLRMQALWSQIADVVVPLMTRSTAPLTAPRIGTQFTVPGRRRFSPLRVEVRRAAGLLRKFPERRWTLDQLAAEVHLSPSRLGSLFVDAYGKTPLAFLTMIRAEQLAKYLRETDLTVAAAMQRVGWQSRSHATQLFRRYAGLSPGEYRQFHRIAE